MIGECLETQCEFSFFFNKGNTFPPRKVNTAAEKKNPKEEHKKQ